MYDTATFLRRNRDITWARLCGDRSTRPTSTNTPHNTKITPVIPQADIPLRAAGAGGGAALFSGVVVVTSPLLDGLTVVVEEFVGSLGDFVGLTVVVDVEVGVAVVVELVELDTAAGAWVTGSMRGLITPPNRAHVDGLIYV